MKKFKTNMIGFIYAKKFFYGYVFNRKDENGYFLKLTPKQERLLTGKVKLIPVTPN